MAPKELKEAIFSVSSPEKFNDLALKIFHHQFENTSVYQKFADALLKDPTTVNSISEIPFLPVSFFKTHRVQCGDEDPAEVFTSSGTTGTEPARHYVADLPLYEKSFLSSFEYFYGNVNDYCILALLPSYLERDGSSLVYMAEKLIEMSGNPLSGFYLNETDLLLSTLHTLKTEGQKVILLGVTFALLDLVERYPLSYPELVVVETGGMKGRRKEMIREELHTILCKGFGVKKIHSEYGMTELLSQAWSQRSGIFKCPPWMKVLIRDVNDPLTRLGPGETGGIDIIDLANIHSCSFISTQDLGRLHEDGSFEVLGRFDESDVRGCNLLVN